MFNTEQSEQKWAAVLDHAEAPAFKDNYRRSVTAALLENQQKALKEERSMLAEADLGTGAIQNFDPILISLVRRAMPNLIAYDIAGVQPMSGPTGLIFALKPKFTTAEGAVAVNDDALYGGVEGTTQSAPAFPTGTTSKASYVTATPSVQTVTGGTVLTISTSSLQAGDLVIGQSFVPGTRISSIGTGTVTVDTALVSTASSSSGILFANLAPIATYFSGTASTRAYTTAEGEALGDSTFKTMGFDIEKTVVTANTRALKASYTMELAQDLKAVHGLDAESELANILSAEILAEINREVIRTINVKAKLGAQTANVTTKGKFNLFTDADGRWNVERFKGLLIQIEREANQIAKDTRRGKGNFILCSSDVATALSSAGVLDYAPALSTQLEVDDTGNTFAGVLNGRTKVYIDPYATADYVTVGYRGTNPYDAGLFYAPYVPLTMVRAVGQADFQPRIGFKTRYGMVANPFAEAPTAPQNDTGTNRANRYFRIFGVTGILDNA